MRIGSYAPFGKLYEIDTLVAEALTEDEEIAFNAGTHKELVKMGYRDYEELAEPQIIPAGIRHT